jgi:hypothetical protein
VERFYKLIRLFCLAVRIILTQCKEFRNAGRWYFVGPPPACGGRRPRAEAAPARRAGRRPKPLSIQKVFDCKWKLVLYPPTPYTLSPFSRGERLGVKGDRTPVCRVLSVPSSWLVSEWEGEDWGRRQPP